MQHGTIKKLRVVMFILLSIVQRQALGCDVCGCFIGVLPYDNQSSLMLLHRYRIFSGYPAWPSGKIFPAGAYRISNHSTLHNQASSGLSPDDYESYKTIELRGKWFIHERVELNFILPVSENRFKTNGIKEQLDGAGDASFIAGFHLLKKTGEEQKFRHRLVAGLGVKVPTGKYNSGDASGERYSVFMQNGTGSLDAIGYIAYTGGGYHFRWGGTFSGKVNGTNRYKEKLAPSLTNIVFAGYLLSSGSWNFLPQLTAYQEYTGGLWINNIYAEESKMNAVLAGPAAAVYHQHISFEASFQLPVYEKKYASELLNKGKFTLGISWNFNQQTYFIKKNN